MKTLFPKKECHIPKWYVIDASGKTLGRLATEASKLLRGKETSYYTPGVDQGNYVVILNAHEVQVSGKKSSQKLYYRNSQRPGSLKIETFKQLQNRIPSRILEEAIWGMLSKNHMGRECYKRLFIYSTDQIPYKATNSNQIETNNEELNKNWIKVDL
jgi:large subunit ribosomal protein L13